jgi:hypothetical protein
MYVSLFRISDFRIPTVLFKFVPLQDQLVGDTALRMLAATVSEAMMSIPPPSKPNHTAPPKQTNMPDYNSSTKRENLRNGALSNSESGKTVSVEATTIAAKKAPTKSESSQALMAKFMQSVTNTGLPGTANSLQQQTGEYFRTVHYHALHQNFFLLRAQKWMCIKYCVAVIIFVAKGVW